MTTTENSLNHLKKNVVNAHSQAGKQWYADLPSTIKILEKHWSLNNIEPVSNMNWNYVAFARKNNHSVVLKISPDKKLIHDEYHALKHFSGVGAIRLVDYHPKLHAILLEQAKPGVLLKDNHTRNIKDVIHIYADVVKKLSLPTHTNYSFHHVREWCKVIDDMNDARIPVNYIKKAKEIRQWLFETITQEYICHGDLHLENVIKHENQWIAIDPKGIIGEMAFEAAAFDLLNQEENNLPEATQLLKERIQQLANALSINEKRLIACIFLRIMLSIQWFIEDKEDPTWMLKMANNIYPMMK